MLLDQSLQCIYLKSYSALKFALSFLPCYLRHNSTIWLQKYFKCNYAGRQSAAKFELVVMVANITGLGSRSLYFEKTTISVDISTGIWNDYQRFTLNKCL